MHTTFAPPAPAGLRSSFTPGVVRRRPPARAAFPRTRCCALEPPETVQNAKLEPTEGSMGDPSGDLSLIAALDRDWDILENFGGALGEPVPQPGLADDEDVVAEPSDREQPSAEDAGQENQQLDEEQKEENVIFAEANADISNQPYEGAESGDVVTATSSGSSGKGKSRGKGGKGGKAGKGKAKTTVKRQTAAQKKAAVQAESDALAAAAIWDRDPKWFFLQTKPGCEQSCAISLRNLAACMPHLQIKEVMVPAMKIMKLTKGGRSVKKEERIYPSYILIHMVMDHRSYSEVQAVPNVQFFMGDPNRDKKKDQPFMPPLPVSEAELRNVFHRMRTAEEARPEMKTTLRPGDIVRILDGRYSGRYATITAVKPDLNSITAGLRAFARNVEVDLSISDVVKEEPPADFDVEDGTELNVNQGKNVKDPIGVDPLRNDPESADLWPEEEDQQPPGKGTAKFSTVLDTLDGPAPRTSDREFDDLLGDDLPSFPARFESPPNVSPRKKRSATKDPVQDLLDLFGEEEQEDVSNRIGDGSGAAAQSGFEEAEVVADDNGSDDFDDWL